MSVSLRSARPSSCTEVRVALEDALAEVSDSRRGRAARRADFKLPAELTSFVGRAEELRRLTRTITDSRLVTLTGVAGCGKTRLALRLAGDRAGEPDRRGHPELCD